MYNIFMKKSRKIKFASYNTYSNNVFIKLLSNPFIQILIIVGLFFILQMTGIVRFFQIGLGAAR